MAHPGSELKRPQVPRNAASVSASGVTGPWELGVLGGWGAAREGHSARPNLGQPGPDPSGVVRSPVRGEGRSMPRFLFKRCLNNHRNPAPATRVPAACLRHLGPQSLSHYSGSGERGPPWEWDAGPLRVGRRRDGVPSSESPPFSEAGAAAGMGPVVQADGGRDVVNPIAGHRPARRSARRRPAWPRTPWLPSWPRARGLRSRGLPPRPRAGVPAAASRQAHLFSCPPVTVTSPARGRGREWREEPGSWRLLPPPPHLLNSTRSRSHSVQNGGRF